eukprot:2055791-Prorocentrum_lima.AAC.1
MSVGLLGEGHPARAPCCRAAAAASGAARSAPCGALLAHWSSGFAGERRVWVCFYFCAQRRFAMG